ncbi:MAG: hypothetical protein ACREAY_00785 [Nitrososphaera sp.]|uniref:hypothetical protein n=1 Tax=Nitrososphaera sp. TaxID=1971748 RepID=UPI003D6FE1AA
MSIGRRGSGCAGNRRSCSRHCVFAGILQPCGFSFHTKNNQTEPAVQAFVILAINDLKDTYGAGEPISFTLITKGASNNICNYPKPSIQIIGIGEKKGVWNTPPTFQTSMGCPLQPFHNEWRFGYSGEELPFQSAFPYDGRYENSITIEEAGRYKMIATFDYHKTEKEFTVVP